MKNLISYDMVYLSPQIVYNFCKTLKIPHNSLYYLRKPTFVFGGFIVIAQNILMVFMVI